MASMLQDISRRLTMITTQLEELQEAKKELTLRKKELLLALEKYHSHPAALPFELNKADDEGAGNK
jgi:hypothetical protein